MEIALPVPDAIGRLQNRLHAELARAIEEWSGFVSTLTQWEDHHLLDDPTPALLADHKATVERLLAFGRFISLVTASPEFTDRRTAEMVDATQLVLKDKLRMWHGLRMSRTESDRILAEVFPDKP
jgi:hypothetical protein